MRRLCSRPCKKHGTCGSVYCMHQLIFISLVLVVATVTDGLHSLFLFLFFYFSPGDSFAAGSSPFLSGYPGHSPLTSDPAYRSANPGGLQMAQLWASHAHEGKAPVTSHTHFRFTFFSPSLSAQEWDAKKEPRIFCNISPRVLRPRRLVLLLLIAHAGGVLLHFCLSAAPGSVLHVQASLSLSWVTVIHLPLLFLVLLCLWLCSSTPLQHLPPDPAHETLFRHTKVFLCPCGFGPLRSLCSSFTERLNSCSLLCLLIKGRV